MSKIRQLSEYVCNRIAAGEVVERPFSVVKELVENSIDAGATEIEISIVRGGKDSITVTDNGCGIERDDLRAACAPHSTSKIYNVEDIDHIQTLGFRGEALASIASIAQIEIISAVEGQTAYSLSVSGQEYGMVEPSSAVTKGTKIIVDRLFFNTPVRYKFMKSDKKEETDITTYVGRYILGRPDISFKYYVDGNLKLQSYGGGIEEAIVQVYGSNVLGNCFKIAVERNNIKLRGYISNQQFFKSNKSYQTLFINGRYINNQLVAAAINNAYAPYMMKKNFPFYVLFMYVNDDIVDFNVHPNKTDVRFSDTSLIYGTVYKAITTILDGTVKAAEYVLADDDLNTFGIHIPKSLKIVQPSVCAGEIIRKENVVDKDFSDVKDIEYYSSKQQPKGKFTPDTKYTLTPEQIAANERDNDIVAGILKPEDVDLSLFRQGDYNQGLSLCSGELYDLPTQQRLEDERILQAEIQQELLYRECKYRCTLFNTYIVYEMRNDVYLIDQHAAHERLLYDQMRLDIENRVNVPRQALIVPYMIGVNEEEMKFLEDNMDAIYQMGFSLEHFGRTGFIITEIPADFNGLNYKEFFAELMSDLSGLKEIKLVDILKDKIAMAACKHAIKGGDTLTEDERNKLFSMLRGNLGLKCPHGRPVCVKLSKKELEKMFKRIV